MQMIDRIKSRGEEWKAIKLPGYRARRWVCERTHSWMNRFRRVLTRWEKKLDNFLACFTWRVRSSCGATDQFSEVHQDLMPNACNCNE